jgi:hypothetical protein
MALSRSALVNTRIKQATSTSSRSTIPRSLIPSRKPMGLKSSRVWPSICSLMMKELKAYLTDKLLPIMASAIFTKHFSATSSISSSSIYSSSPSYCCSSSLASILSLTLTVSCFPSSSSSLSNNFSNSSS